MLDTFDDNAMNPSRLDLESKLQSIKERGLSRTLVSRQKGIDFHSNDYLGLAGNGAFKEQVLKTLRNSEYPIGSTGSRLISGNYRALEKLEDKLARFHGYEDALIFQSGYQANLALMTALGERHKRVFYDENIHASLRQGIRLSASSSQAFRHQDFNHLEDRLKKTPKSFVVVEGIYSMDGDKTHLSPLVQLCQLYGSELIVDEAHSVGVCGQKGEGLVAAHKLQSQTFATVVTYGKAFGAQGAAILCSNALKRYLVNKASPFIYTTAPSGMLTAAIDVAYDFVSQAIEKRRALDKLINYFNERKKSTTGMKFLTSQSPIQGVFCALEDMQETVDQLRRRDLCLTGIRSPTVRRSQERLRIVLHSFNSKEDIDYLFASLEEM